jgi:predicted alpha/beta-hydrolase family hydrolase
MDSKFMNDVAAALAASGIRVVRFEFPYMRARREAGRRGAPDRPSVLLDTWRDVIRHLGPERLAVGGKSMGGRIASMVADEEGVRALVCLGYPFHPPGKPERLRTAHLAGLRTPTLIVQGTRDTFGSREDVESYDLSAAIHFAWIEGGDHSFKPSAKTGSEQENLGLAVDAVRTFLSGLS